MCFKYINIVYCWVYLCCQVSLLRCEVTYVYRDKSNDIFRIGNDSCTKNESVCTSAKAYCSPSNGLCICKGENPHFRNPTIEIKDGSYRYGSSYGCLTENLIQQRINNNACKITPYQLIPYDPNVDATTFILKDGKDKCYLKNVEAKYPNSNMQHNIPWLNESFIEFGFPLGNEKLSVKWKKSVPRLKGLIITIHLHCTKSVNGKEVSTNYCLQAKVSGVWTLSGSSMMSANTETATPVPSTPPDYPKTSASTGSTASVPSSSPDSIEIFPSTEKYLSTKNSNTKGAVLKESKYWKDVAIPLSAVMVFFILLSMILGGLLAVKIRQIRRNQGQRTNAKKAEAVGNQNPAYDYPMPQYAELGNCRQSNDNNHIYQGLTGVSRNNTQSSKVDG